MSSQRGNIQRSRAQKHQNSFVFKNDLHDKTVKIKMINNLEVSGVCSRCKDIIEWRIKYKKYKPLTVPKKCTKCERKTVQFAYHVLCQACSQEFGLCSKCSKPEELATSLSAKEQEKQKNEFEQQLKSLSERQRRTLMRSIAKSGDVTDCQNKNLSNYVPPNDEGAMAKMAKLEEMNLDSSSSDDDI